MDVFIDADGSVQAVYDDRLVELFEGERLETRRASHVEPAPGGGWAADLGPVGGPVLGPYATRQAALTAEVEWLGRALEAGRLEVAP